ncbi:DoxX family membrane protein [Lutibacter sp.]|uniref:DoxX family protein n=1 Tax=Lutibacter sp. TaxID=1925666 RepID=UPI001A270001|nr:DoxX family membrane protein [Lutibacter sp.]MBI9040978.1 DoxX family membrane protein [Lutibacter sp.]
MKSNSLKIWTILKFVIAIFMIYAGAQHFIKPTFFMPFVPDFLPLKTSIIYISGAVEILLGAMLFLKKYSKFGALGIIILLIVFLPIHIWDVFSQTPAIGSKQAAFIRLPIQFILIYIVWKIKNSISQSKKTASHGN